MRWERGLGETLDHCYTMLGKQRFGRIGLFALPYMMVFEYLSPLVEVAGWTTPAWGCRKTAPQCRVPGLARLPTDA